MASGFLSLSRFHRLLARRAIRARAPDQRIQSERNKDGELDKLLSSVAPGHAQCRQSFSVCACVRARELVESQPIQTEEPVTFCTPLIATGSWSKLKHRNSAIVCLRDCVGSSLLHEPRCAVCLIIICRFHRSSSAHFIDGETLQSTGKITLSIIVHSVRCARFRSTILGWLVWLHHRHRHYHQLHNQRDNSSSGGFHGVYVCTSCHCRIALIIVIAIIQFVCLVLTAPAIVNVLLVALEQMSSF